MYSISKEIFCQFPPWLLTAATVGPKRYILNVHLSKKEAQTWNSIEATWFKALPVTRRIPGENNLQNKCRLILENFYKRVIKPILINPILWINKSHLFTSLTMWRFSLDFIPVSFLLHRKTLLVSLKTTSTWLLWGRVNGLLFQDKREWPSQSVVL